jgi:redox-sensitive bicupin YhaK (pirin superfamily)
MKKKILQVVSRPGRYGMVGDGFRVFNYFPGMISDRKLVSPFLMLDFNPAYDFGPSEQPRGVDVHPHKGFETVTIAYQGSVAHHDSSGNSGVIHPGDVQWMTAGAGILHKEYHETNFSRAGGPFEMVQLWVNLPKKDKLTPPKYQALEAAKMNKITLADKGGYVNIIAGELNGKAGSATTFTPINVYDVKLNANGSMEFDTPEKHNTFILVINGKVEVNGEAADTHQFVIFKNEGQSISIKAQTDSVLLVLSGEPIDEPIAQYGPFVMNTQEELQEAFQEYQSGKFGVLN